LQYLRKPRPNTVGTHLEIEFFSEQNGGDGNTPQNTVTTISLDLTNMTCSGADLTKLQAVNIYLQPGTYRIDYVRAE